MNWFRSLLHRLYAPLDPWLQPLFHRLRLLHQKYPSWGWFVDAKLRPYPRLFRAYMDYRRWVWPRAKRMVWPWLHYYRRSSVPRYNYRRLFPIPIRLCYRFYRWFLHHSVRFFFLFPSLLFAYALYRGWPSALHLLWTLLIPFQLAVLTDPLGLILSLFRPLLPGSATLLWHYCYDLKPIFEYHLFWITVCRFHLFALAYGSLLLFWFLDLYRGLWPRHYRPDPFDFKELYLDFTDHFYANYLEHAYGEETWTGVNMWWVILQDVNDRAEHWTIWDIESSNFWILDDEEWLSFYWYLNRVCFAVYWPTYLLWLAVRFFTFFWLLLFLPPLYLLLFLYRFLHPLQTRLLRFIRFAYHYLVELLWPFYYPPFRLAHCFLHLALLRLENRPKFDPWKWFTEEMVSLMETYGSIAKLWTLIRRARRALKWSRLRRFKKLHRRRTFWLRLRLIYVPFLFGPLLFLLGASFVALSRLWAFVLFRLPPLLLRLSLRLLDLFLYLLGHLPFGGGLPLLLRFRLLLQKWLAVPLFRLIRAVLTPLLLLRNFGERSRRQLRAAAVALHRHLEVGGWRLLRLLEELLLRRLLIGGNAYAVYLGWYVRVLAPVFLLLLLATPAGLSALWTDLPHPPPYWDLAVFLFLLFFFRFSFDSFRHWLYWDYKEALFGTLFLTLSIFGALWGKSWVPSILYKSFWLLLGHLWVTAVFPLILLVYGSFSFLFGHLLFTLPTLLLLSPAISLLCAGESACQLAVHWVLPQLQLLGFLFDEAYLSAYPFLQPKVQLFLELAYDLLLVLNRTGSAFVLFAFEKVRGVMEFYAWFNRQPFAFLNPYHKSWLLRLYF